MILHSERLKGTCKTKRETLWNTPEWSEELLLPLSLCTRPCTLTPGEVFVPPIATQALSLLIANSEIRKKKPDIFWSARSRRRGAGAVRGAATAPRTRPSPASAYAAPPHSILPRRSPPHPSASSRLPRARSLQGGVRGAGQTRCRAEEALARPLWHLFGGRAQSLDLLHFIGIMIIVIIMIVAIIIMIIIIIIKFKQLEDGDVAVVACIPLQTLCCTLQVSVPPKNSRKSP